jgi:hypothetical protein
VRPEDRGHGDIALLEMEVEGNRAPHPVESLVDHVESKYVESGDLVID